MNIIYVSGMCSNDKFKELQNSGVVKKLPQAQKYHSLLVKGLQKNLNNQITALCAYPVNRKWTKRIIFKEAEEINDNIYYKYPFFINYFLLRQLSLFLFGFFNTFSFLRNNKESVVLCDVLNISVSSGAKFASKIFRRPCIGIVTDVPGIRSNARTQMLSKFSQYLIKKIDQYNSRKIVKYNGYLLLTEAMNSKVNTNNKPYLVLEGHSDISMSTLNCDYNRKPSKIILYSGGVHKQFGIERLVQSFIRIRNNDWTLHIYGDGNYSEELSKISEIYKNIKYYGVVDNKTIIKKQMEADILINPRLTNSDFIRYSFPSKIMEYMASGKPLLTTILPGMPKEYYEYIYMIENESIDGFIQAIERTISINPQALIHKGQEAKKFVLEKKNNVIQASKLIKFINDNF